MAKSKDGKKTESKKNDESIDEKSQAAEVRYEIVDPKRVFRELERFGLPTEGTPNERTDRLSSYYAHEAQKSKGAMIDCQPDDESDPLGCRIKSPDGYDECPFCGKGGDIVTLPKEAPKADRDIELNVVAAGKKPELAKPLSESKASSDKPVKVSAKDIKAKKKERGEVIENKGESATLADAIVQPKPEIVAVDLPSVSTGGTIHDLERIEHRVDEVTEGMLTNQALSMWELGTLLAEIRDKKLWSLPRHADDNFKYVNFNSYVAQRFDFTPDHAMLMIRIASSMTRENAAIGSAKAKAILDAKLPDDMTANLVAFASEKDERGYFIHSLVELRMKIKGLKDPQLPPAPSQSATTSVSDDDEDRDDGAAEDDDDLDEDDSDDEDDEPRSSRPTPNKTKAQPAKMFSVSYETREMSIPLVQKGSQIKEAKKIQDEPHATEQLPGGVKIHYTIRIGDGGQLFLDRRVETPY